MARVGWQFAGYTWPINPEKDSGWVGEEVYSETVPIRSTQSNLQWGGRKSRRRQVSGWLYGPEAQTQFNTMAGWKANRTRSTLVDHFGLSLSAVLVKFEAELVHSNGEWLAGRPTFRYNAEFVAT